jgi:mannose-6-phosphate isomerase
MTFERIDAPWGHQEILEKNDCYMVKKLFMKDGHRCSRQYHQKKIETVFILNGKLKLSIEPDDEFHEDIVLIDKIYNTGDSVTIPSCIIHRMEAVDGDCIYLECSTPHENDTIRISDDYGRI